MGCKPFDTYEKDIEKDMEEIEGEKYSGFGIKRMKGYKCKLKSDQLEKLRKKFWKKN